jgi:hypothetical protein
MVRKKAKENNIWLLQKTRVLLRFLSNFLDLNNSGHRVYTKQLDNSALLAMSE